MEKIIAVSVVILYFYFIFGGLDKFFEKKKPTTRKISTLSRKRKLSSKRRRQKTVDLHEIRALAEDRLSGNISNSALLGMPHEIASLVILTILEKQIMTIAHNLYVEWSYRFKEPNGNGQYRNTLYKAYIELDSDSKHELMPLYFSPDMKTDNSIYVCNERYTHKMRNASFLEFSNLVKQDGLSINTLKQQYVLNHEYHYLLPLWTRTLAHDEYATPSERELMIANPELLNANPKLRKTNLS